MGGFFLMSSTSLSIYFSVSIWAVCMMWSMPPFTPTPHWSGRR